MDNFKYIVWDTEGNSLHPDKFYCLAYMTSSGESGLLTEYKDFKEFFRRDDYYYVAHNCMLWDFPNLERVVGIEKPTNIIDSLWLSYYINHNRVKHGLESYGADLGIEKPPIEDWNLQKLEDYYYRCSEDVKINKLAFENMFKKLLLLYPSLDSLLRFIKYLNFKITCVKLQEESKFKLDVDLCLKSVSELEKIRDNKISELKKSLPLVPVYKTHKRPKQFYNKDGFLSSRGSDYLIECSFSQDDWGNLTPEKVPIVVPEKVKVLSGFIEPNPNSPIQIKDWLFSLGWKPKTFKEVKRKDGSIDEVPQINLPRQEGICQSVLDLKNKDNGVLILEDLGVLSHRISVLKGFLKNVDQEGYILATANGLTNTLRLKHSILVNLPKPDKKYSESIRACLIPSDGLVLCGADMSSLEDRTKQHFMFEFDPEYVKEMNTEDFDPHIDIAILTGMMSEEDGRFYKRRLVEKDHEKIQRLDKIRSLAKNTNYAGVYGAGPRKIAKTAGISIGEARKLHETYWERNWSVKAISKAQKIKYLKQYDENWLYNPISGFYYSLRDKKDIFSTLNQSTGVYCFDIWVSKIIEKRPSITAQFHDEVIIQIPKGKENEMSSLLKSSIEETNSILGLNRELDIGIKYGERYSEIH